MPKLYLLYEYRPSKIFGRSGGFIFNYFHHLWAVILPPSDNGEQIQVVQMIDNFFKDCQIVQDIECSRPFFMIINLALSLRFTNCNITLYSCERWNNFI